jgi:hypothetical protein
MRYQAELRCLSGVENATDAPTPRTAPTGSWFGSAPSGNNLVLSFTVGPPSTYLLQTSTNLLSWEDLETNGPFAGPTTIHLLRLSVSVSFSSFNP